MVLIDKNGFSTSYGIAINIPDTMHIANEASAICPNVVLDNIVFTTFK